MLTISGAVIGCYHGRRRGFTFTKIFIEFLKDQTSGTIVTIVGNRESEDRKPLIPGNGGSNHFIIHKKSEIPTNPVYVPSVPGIMPN